MVFLSMGFVSKSGGQVRYGEQVYFQVFPFVFTALAIICMQKYKLKVYYQFDCSSIPKTEQRVQQAMTALLFVLMLLLPSISMSRKVSDLAAKTVNLVLQLSFLLALSAISLRLTYKLRERFDTHNLYFAKTRISWLEVLIQTIIWTRLLTSTVQIIWKSFSWRMLKTRSHLWRSRLPLQNWFPFASSCTEFIFRSTGHRTTVNYPNLHQLSRVTNLQRQTCIYVKWSMTRTRTLPRKVFCLTVATTSRLYSPIRCR